MYLADHVTPLPPTRLRPRVYPPVVRDETSPTVVANSQRPTTDSLTDEALLDLFYAMLVTRLLSEQMQRLAAQGVIDVAIPSEGHEAAQVASMRAVRVTDPAYLFYRSVPAAYARGMTAREIMLDAFGRAAGPSSGGKNLPGHWSHSALRLMSISGSVGTQIPHAVGTAMASRLRG